MSTVKHKQIFFSAIDNSNKEFVIINRPVSYAQACDIVFCATLNFEGTKYYNHYKFSIDKESNTLIGTFGVHPTLPVEDNSLKLFTQEFLEHF